MDVWEPQIGEILTLEREPHNAVDQHAVLIVKSGIVVGHVPFNLAPVFSPFLKRSFNKGTTEITGGKVNRRAGYGLVLNYVDHALQSRPRFAGVLLRPLGSRPPSGAHAPSKMAAGRAPDKRQISGRPRWVGALPRPQGTRPPSDAPAAASRAEIRANNTNWCQLVQQLTNAHQNVDPRPHPVAK